MSKALIIRRKTLATWCSYEKHRSNCFSIFMEHHSEYLSSNAVAHSDRYSTDRLKVTRRRIFTGMREASQVEIRQGCSLRIHMGETGSEFWVSMLVLDREEFIPTINRFFKQITNPWKPGWRMRVDNSEYARESFPFLCMCQILTNRLQHWNM